MNALRFVLKNFRPVLILTAQEAVAALLLAGGLYVVLSAARGSGAHAWAWDVSFFPRLLGEPAAPAGLLVLVLLVGAAFLVTRLLLLGGTFGVLASGWGGMAAFRRDAHRAFGRFLLLGIVFALPAFALLAGVSAGVEAAGKTVADSRWPLWGMILRGAGMVLFLTPLAYLHAASRFRTLEAGRLRLSFRLRLRPLLAFYGYTLPDLPLAASMIWMVAAMLRGTTGWGILPWIAAFEAAALARNAFRLAAFRCAFTPGPDPPIAGPRFQPGAEADPPLLTGEEEGAGGESQVAEN